MTSARKEFEKWAQKKYNPDSQQEVNEIWDHAEDWKAGWTARGRAGARLGKLREAVVRVSIAWVKDRKNGIDIIRAVEALLAAEKKAARGKGGR